MVLTAQNLGDSHSQRTRLLVRLIPSNVALYSVVPQHPQSRKSPEFRTRSNYIRDVEHCGPKILKGAHFVGTSPALTRDFALTAIVGVLAAKLHIWLAVLRVLTEYLLIRHVQKREQLSEAARVDDLYCSICVQCARSF